MAEPTSDLIDGILGRLDFLSGLGLTYVFESPDQAVTSRDRLQNLDKRIRGCRECPLWKTRSMAVPGEGSPDARLMFVGEGPGHDEDVQGRPFVGKAGQLLTRIISAMKFTREQVYITNIVKCRPPQNRNPNAREIDACRGYLREQLKIIRPRVIVTLGNVPTQYFLQTTQGITGLRGRFHDCGGFLVMPTFHPSYIIRRDNDKDIKRLVWSDMQKVLARLGR